MEEKIDEESEMKRVEIPLRIKFDSIIRSILDRNSLDFFESEKNILNQIECSLTI